MHAKRGLRHMSADLLNRSVSLAHDIRIREQFPFRVSVLKKTKS
jgi:hypothetical protein